MTKNFSDFWILNRRYNIFTTKGRIEAHVVQENVAIMASDYRNKRWHQRLTYVRVGGKVHGATITRIEERDD